MRLPRISISASRSCASVLVALGQFHLLSGSGMGNWTEFSGRVLRSLALGVLPAVFLLRNNREEIYNVLWTLVFGFATLNILSLGARRFEQGRSGLSFGETLAILVVLVSIVLLSWELLYVFHVLPLHLTPR